MPRPMSPSCFIKHCSVLALFCVLVVGGGFAQPRNGSAGLRVLVADSQQRPVGGAVCSLIPANNNATAAATASTDERGVAKFPSTLTSGNYTLRVESPGFETFSRNEFVLKDGEITKVAISLKVAAVTESVTVAAPADEATNVQAGSSTTAGILKRDSLQRLPLAAARVDQALPLIPGVVRSSTGEISIEGATEQQSTLLVNGLNASDPASGNFRLNLPIDSVESVQVFQHPYTAEYGAFTGGVAAVETRRGKDRWHFEVNDFLPDLRFKGGHIRGVAEDTPRLNFNGPLIRDRLFLSQSLSYSIAKQAVRGLPFPVNETKSESQSYFSQFDLILSNRHTQTFTFAYSPQRDQFVDLDFFRPQPVTPNYKQKDFVVTVRDHYQVREGLLQSAVSFKRFDANVWGQGEDEQVLTPTVEQGNYFATQSRSSHRLEVFEVYSSPAKHFLGAGHEIKVGFDFNSVGNLLNYSARPVNLIRED